MDKQTRAEYFTLALKIIGFLAIILSFIWFIGNITWVITLLVISVLIVYSISPLADWLEKQGLSRTAASAITFLALLLFMVGLLSLTIPRLYSEIQALANYAPHLYRELEPYLYQLNELMEEPAFGSYIEDLFEDLPQTLENVGGIILQITNFSIVLITGFFEFLIVMFLVFYLLRDIKDIKKGIIGIFPFKYQKEAYKILEVIDLKVGQYLRGNLLRCLLVGVLTGFGLFLLDIRFFVVLGLIAAVLNIIVYIGPYIAAFPAVLIALSYSIHTAIIVAIMYVVIQGIDAFVLTPILLGKAVDLRPFTTIIALLIGGTLYGIIGVLISIPIAATIKVLINYYYLDHNLLK